MTISYLTAVMKVANYNGDTFYASDLGLKGGTIQGLFWDGLIERTGNKKTYFVEIRQNVFRKCEALEWRIINRAPVSVWRKKEVASYAKEVLKCADFLKSDGGF